MFTTRGHNGSNYFVDTASMQRQLFGFVSDPKQRTSADMRLQSFGLPTTPSRSSLQMSPAQGSRAQPVPYDAPNYDMQKAFDRSVKNVGSINLTGRHGIPLVEHQVILGRITQNNAG